MDLLQFNSDIFAGSSFVDGGTIDPNTGLPLDDQGHVVDTCESSHDDDIHLCNDKDKFGDYLKRFECLQSATSSQALLRTPIVPLIAACVIIGKQLVNFWTRCIILFGISLISVELPIVLPVFGLSVLLSEQDVGRINGTGQIIVMLALVQLFIYLTGLCDLVSSTFNLVFNFALLLLLGAYGFLKNGVKLVEAGRRSSDQDDELLSNLSEPGDLFTRYDDEDN
jgi:hypothetical protein